MMDKIKVMFLSDSPITPTGFANITNSIATRLAKNSDFEVTYVGHNYFGPEIQNYHLDDPNGQQIEIPYRLLPGTQGVPYAAQVLQHYISRFKPDIFFVLLDTFMLMGAPNLPLGWFLNLNVSPAKFLMYFPSDGENFPFRCESILRKSQYPVAMAKFGQRQVADLFGIVSDYVPHHCDTKLFSPPTPEEKKKWRKQWNLPEKAFIFGSVARNQGRKMMGTSIEAFGKFMKRNPNANALLLLHCDPVDAAAYTDLVAVSHEFGISDKVIFTGMKFNQGFPREKMREVYGVMDVHILTTTGEGFGIPIIEAMSCGVPNIITDYTTTEELTDGGKCGWKVPVGVEIYGTWNVKRGFVQVDNLECPEGHVTKSGFVSAMEDAFNNPEKIKEFGKLSREKVVREYDFDTVVFPRWLEILNRLVVM